jgi:hypothetical protein
VEIAYNENQQSPKYRSKIAFPTARITRSRDDKAPEDSSAIVLVREIYERQFSNKGKYTTT